MINEKEPSSIALDPVTQTPDVSTSRVGAEGQSDVPKDGLRAQREQAMMVVRKASRVTYDLPPDLRISLRILSEELCIPASQLAALALIRFFERIQKRCTGFGKL